MSPQKIDPKSAPYKDIIERVKNDVGYNKLMAFNNENGAGMQSAMRFVAPELTSDSERQQVMTHAFNKAEGEYYGEYDD